MMLLLSLLIALAYATVTGISGWLCLLKSGFRFRNEVVGVLCGFFMVEGVSFFFFAALGLAGINSFYASFFPNVVAALVAIGLTVTQSFSRSMVKNLFRALRTDIAIPVVTVVIVALYVAETWPQLKSALTETGVVYQDIIFHSGIVSSLEVFGFPLVDVQQSGYHLKYHIFSHFLTARVSFLSAYEPFKVYLTSMVVLGALFFSMITSCIVTAGLGEHRHSGRPLFAVGLLLLFFLSSAILGGIVSTAFVSGFFFSASYQWQLILLFLILILLMDGLKQRNFDMRSIALIILFSALAIVAKLSSAPLILAGMGGLWLYTLIYERSMRVQTLVMILVALGISIGVVLVFFSRNGGTGGHEIIRFSLEYSNTLPVISKLGLRDNMLSLIIFLLCTTSFRFILALNIKDPVVWFLIPATLSGWLFSLVFTTNPGYFLMPALAISGLYSLILFFKVKQPRLVVVMFLSALALSTYPIASFGFGLRRQVQKKIGYFPLTPHRVALYEWLKENTSRDQVIFTTSVYVDDAGTADNYYPPALSRRAFLLGGYRFGDHNTAFFEKRRQLVDNFTLSSREQRDMLRAEGIEYILIERVGNKLPLDVHLGGTNFGGNEFYEGVFENDAGWIFRIKN